MNIRSCDTVQKTVTILMEPADFSKVDMVRRSSEWNERQEVSSGYLYMSANSGAAQYSI